MSYESKLDRQSGKLINPAKLSLLLSVALHLLVLKFGLPSIDFNNDSGRREVSIIELNPEQQTRLPNVSPQLDTPNVPDLGDLPFDDSEPAAPFAIPPSLIPGVGNPDNLSPLVIPPPPNFDNLPPLPPITDITLPPVGDLSNLPLPPQISPEDFKVDPAKLPPPTTDKPEQPSVPETQPEAQLEPKPQPEAKPAPQPEVKPQPTPEQIAARKAAENQQRISQLSQSLKRDRTGTSDEEARKNYVAWLAKVQDVEPESIEIKGTYPRDACIRRLEGSSVYGVVVDAEGKVVALDLIKGAKYPIFNQQASQEIIETVLENDSEKPKPYQVTVNYEYDSEICPSLTLPSIRRQEEKEERQKTEPIPKPEAKPAPEPEPVPKPEPKPEPAPAPEAKPEPEPKSEPAPAPAPAPAPTPAPEPTPLPSLRDRLRDIPLPDRKPVDFKDIPLPDKPNFGN